MKKILLSLSAIALLAVGTVSCSKSDDSTPPGPEKLTENYIEVDGEQAEITYSIYAVHTNGAGAEAPIMEYTLNDGTVVAAFEFISHDGNAATQVGEHNTWITYYTLVDTTKPAGSEERILWPYEDPEKTFVVGLETGFGTKSYEYATTSTYSVTALSYASATAKFGYDLNGVAKDNSSIQLTSTQTDFKLDGLYVLNAQQAAKGKQANGIAKIDHKKAQILLKK